MIPSKSTQRLYGILVTLGLSGALGCGASGAAADDQNTGGNPSASGQGGTESALAGTGGSISSGGTGGAPLSGIGNINSTALSTGGASTGGAKATSTGATGGTKATSTATTGGTKSTGTGGAPSIGGSKTATGGSVATGGSKAAATGGTKAAATGGVPATGGSKASTGGAVSTSCASGLTGSPAASSASFTWYYFGQGTYQANGKYQTACGYQGTETTNSGQNSVDNVTNIANSAYFVAIPGADSSNFTNVNKCGACVQITNAGKSSIATVIDECPINSNALCANNGALDLSTSLFNSLGYSVGNPSGTTWTFVPCPVTGSVVVRFKPNNNNQEIYVENTILAIASVTSSSAGAATRTSYGSWHFNAALAAGSTLTITDAAGRSITWTIAATTADANQSTGKQFPSCS